MGMFDSYKPVPELECPICKIVLDDWQGKDSECGLFVWKQGIAFPVRQDAGNCNIDENERLKLRLPESFEIYTNCENHWIEAEWKTENGIWIETISKKIEEHTKKFP